MLLELAIIAAGFLMLAPILKVQRVTDFMIFCIFVLSFDLLYGYMGRLSFGHMLFLGPGPMEGGSASGTSRKTLSWPSWRGLPWQGSWRC